MLENVSPCAVIASRRRAIAFGPMPCSAASSVRRFGMGIVQRVGPLKNWFMAEARGENGELPLLLRGLTI